MRMRLPEAVRGKPASSRGQGKGKGKEGIRPQFRRMGIMYQAPQQQHTRARIPVRIPGALALPLLGVMLATIVAVGPALLGPKMRSWFGPTGVKTFTAIFVGVTFVAGMTIGAPILFATGDGWYRASVIDDAGLFAAPLLFAWCASAFAWVELGWVGSILAVWFALVWGGKLVWCPTVDGTDFWPDMNPVMYGGGIALLVIAPIVAWFGRASQTATATPPPQPAQAFSPYAGYR